MKAVVYERYGDPHVLRVAEVAAPVIQKPHQLLVKIAYSSLNAIDWKNRRGDFRMVSGLWGPRIKQGFDFVGFVTEKADDVSDIQVGDRVVGQLGNFVGGALCEFVVVDASQVVVVPRALDSQQLAGMPMAATTAWQALFENAHLTAGQSVLVNGGSSGVGHFAIQIAKAYGAEVTSVSSGKNTAFCRRMGADTVIDYEKEDFSRLNRTFDVVFDVVFNTSYQRVKHLLTPTGCYIGTTPSLRLLSDIVFLRRAQFVAVRPNQKALADIVRLMEQGKVVTHIDRVFALDDIVEAHAYLQQSRTVGKVIVKVE